MVTKKLKPSNLSKTLLPRSSQACLTQAVPSLGVSYSSVLKQPTTCVRRITHPNSSSLPTGTPVKGSSNTLKKKLS